MTSELNDDGPPSDEVVLEVIDGPHRDLKVQFGHHASLVAGRGREAQLRLEQDRHFSRYHFRVEINPPRGILMDLNSRNGTLVNGQRVTQAMLKHGDIISGGRTRIRFTVNSAKQGDGVNPLSPVGGEPTRIVPEGVPIPVVMPTVPVASRPSPDAPSERIGPYILHEQLGKGGMGVVHRAVHSVTGQEVAVKIVVPVTTKDLNAKKLKLLFLREAQVLSQLTHPRIVRFLQLGVDAGRLFIAMEYVPSLSFHELTSGQSPENQTRVACGVICQVLQSLHFAHRQSFVHRDIKPGNILIFREGRRIQSKLADFGLAKSMLTAGFSSMTGEGEFRGSLQFLPPEQLLDCRFAKPACDLYSAGVTLYWYLSHAYPFEQKTVHAYAAAIMNEPPEPITRYRPDLPEGLVAVIHKAIQKSPSQRFQTASEMGNALRPYSQRTS